MPEQPVRRYDTYLIAILISSIPPLSSSRQRGIPNYNYKKGKLTFAKAKTLNAEPEEPMVHTFVSG